MSEDTIDKTGIHMLSFPHLESTAVVHVGRAEMEVPCSCGIVGQIHRYNNVDVLIVISCACFPLGEAQLVYVLGNDEEWVYFAGFVKGGVLCC